MMCKIFFFSVCGDDDPVSTRHTAARGDTREAFVGVGIRWTKQRIYPSKGVRRSKNRSSLLVVRRGKSGDTTQHMWGRLAAIEMSVFFVWIMSRTLMSIYLSLFLVALRVMIILGLCG